MPSRPRASAKRKRASKPARRPSLLDLADAMETPLARAQDLARTLEYVGYGLSSLGEDSAPAIFGLATALSENLETVKRSWQKLFQRASKSE